MTIMKLFNDYKYSDYVYFAGLVFFLTLSTILCVIPVHASTNLTIFPLNSTPFGKSYSEWTAIWWKWFIEIPYDSKHPFLDPDGANCSRNQSGSVWFLSGSLTDPIVKTCIIPSGKAILFPILNYECSYAEDKTITTPARLLTCAESGRDSMKILHFQYKGKDIPPEQIKQFRVETPPFTVNFPQLNVFSGTPGPTTSVSDGYWVMFEPPSPGNYDIRFGGCGGDCPATAKSTGNFHIGVTYHLKVLPP
jgi:hypothetical protein